MSEIIEPYQGDRTVICQRCRVVIGTYTEIDGRTWLQIGVVVVRDFSGRCQVCSAPVYFHSTDKTLEKVLERRRKWAIVTS